jgi:transposase
MLRPGAPGRDLPARDGPWRTVARRFDRWQRAGSWAPLLAAVPAQADAHDQLNGDRQDRDGTMLRAPPHAAGAQTGLQRLTPAAAAGAVSVPQSICALTGAAS